MVENGDIWNRNVAAIAFDFDGVIAATMDLFIQVAHEEFGQTHLQVDDITDYAMTSLGLPEDMLIDMMLRLLDPAVMGSLEAMPGAAPVLQDICAAGHPILVITAREDGGPVREWLGRKLVIPEERVIVIGTGDFDAKRDVLESFGKTLFVEDRLETCESLGMAGIHPILFSQPWNRREHGFHEVASWESLSRLLREKALA